MNTLLVFSPAFVSRIFSLTFLVLISALAAAEAANVPAWKVGTASVVITPEKKLWMAGYAFRNKPAEGKDQDLFAKALAFEDEQGTRLVLVTADLSAISRALRTGVEQKVKAAHGLPREALLLNASHTHSGPMVRAASARPEVQRDTADYAAALEDKVVRIIGEALKNLAPANVTWNQARAGFAMNRRLPTPKGFINEPNPDGPVDHQVPVLRVESPAGELRAALFGYACHNTTMRGYVWGGDYAGYAQQYLQEHRKDFTAHFLMGCGGDQNPYPRMTGDTPMMTELDNARSHGRTLANAVEVALRVPRRPITGPLLLACDSVQLDYADGRPPADYPVQVIKFGSSFTLVALASEAVVDYSLRLKRELAGDTAVWVAAYCNDILGYIPSQRVLREGGYEATAGWAESVEEKIITKVHQLHRQLQPPARKGNKATDTLLLRDP